MTEPVVLKLLGPPLIEVDSHPVVLARRKTMALLAWLALERRDHARDSLAALLWPECGQTHSRANLRSSIFELNHVLGTRPLKTSQDLIHLDICRMKIDVDDFRTGAFPCGGHDPEILCSECAPRAEEAAALWRAAFMAGFSLRDSPDFDEWQIRWSGRLREEYCVLLRRLAAHHLRRKDYRRADDFALAWIETEPYEEEARFTRLGILLAAERREAALESLEEWEHMSREELGRPLSPRIAELVRDLRGNANPAGRAAGTLDSAPGLDDAAGGKSGRPPADWMVGRERERSELECSLRDTTIRLHSVTGTGGIGKTLLARHIARSAASVYPGGTHFVELAALRDPALVPSAVAKDLGIMESRRAGEGVEAAIAAGIGSSRRLVVLDNFEHLLAARGFVARLLAACPGLTVLVTSRECLGLPGEREYRLGPLRVPPRPERCSRADCEDVPSVLLLTVRARAASPAFSLTDANAPAMASICRRLDGLPLALELAAARIAVMEPEELLARLHRRFELLHAESAAVPERHRTLHSVIDWSWELLDDRDRRIFAALAVFPGGFDLPASEAVCEEAVGGDCGSLVDGLASLVAKSLLARRAERGTSRFRMLESIRDYAAEQLEEQPWCRSVRFRHAGHYLAMAEQEAAALHGRRQSDALSLLDREHLNLRAAIGFFISAGDSEAALRMVSSLEWYWYRSGRWTEGRASIEASLSLPQAAGYGILKGRSLRALGWLTFIQGEWRTGRAHFLEAEEILRAEDDFPWLVRCLADLGVVECWLGDRQAGTERAREAVALARRLGEPGLIARALIWAYGTNGGRKVEENQDERLEEAVRLARQAGDRWAEAHALESLGDSLREEGRYEMAGACFEEGLKGFDELGDIWMKAWSIEGLGMNDCLRGDPAAGAGRLRESIALFSGAGARLDAIHVLGELGIAAELQGNEDRADLFLGAASALRDEAVYGAEMASPGAGLSANAPTHLEQEVAAAGLRKSAAWCRGIRLSYEEAIAHALSDPACSGR